MDDLISRQAAIDAAKDWYNGLIVGSFKSLEKRLQAVPSEQPKRKRGKWINAYDRGVAFKRCSECGAYVEDVFFANDYEVNFCPNCGADMRGKPRLHITESEEDKDGRGR